MLIRKKFSRKFNLHPLSKLFSSETTTFIPKSKEECYRTLEKVQEWRHQLKEVPPIDLMGWLPPDQEVQTVPQKVYDIPANDPSISEEQLNDIAFQYLVATLLSVQSNDTATAKVMTSLFKHGPMNVQTWSKYTEAQIFRMIKSINFNKKKSNFIYLATQDIQNNMDGKVPDTLNGLKSFKGVGDKVANIVLQQVFGVNEGIAVDLHVARISNRLGWVNTKSVPKLTKELNQIFEPVDFPRVNYYLVTLGQMICAKRKPKCSECPVSEHCEFVKGLDIPLS